jgi:3-ketoacyl-CoA synthase
MGCSAGLISIDLAKQLLQNRPGSLAVVISLEEISQNLYLGNKKSMLLQNTLFRSGGSAVLLSNKPIDAFRAKYKLLHSIRVQDTSETALNAVYQTEDENGVRGVALSKELVGVAAKTLRDNLTMLGPHVLPLREMFQVVLSLTHRRVATTLNKLADKLKLSIPFTNSNGRLEIPSVYIPDFKKGVQHFCIHAGGRAVIDGIEANLSLQPHHVAPSRATLKNWGNTSSSSIWYELKYAEGEEDKWIIPPEEGGGHLVRKGDRVLQIAFGSGFKCNSAVWLRIR